MSEFIFEVPVIPVADPTANASSIARAHRRSRRQNPIDPATSRQRGSITWDREHGYNLEWESPQDFHKWREHEQRAHGIELRITQTRGSRASANQSPLFSESRLFVCARQGTGGTKKYEKKTNRETRDSKRIEGGCPCNVRIKMYPFTTTVLGKYSPDHSHPTGKDNLKYVRIRVPTLEQIAGLIRLGLTDREIKKRTRAQFSEDERDHYITLGEIARLRKGIDREVIQFDPNDANSTRIYADNLRAEGHFIFYKDKQDSPPEGSGLALDLFAFCIQMKFQLESFRDLGDAFLGMDATHNVTQYKGILLFTIMARDRWGHGVPVAWMLSSNGTQATIKYFINLIKSQSPDVSPSIFMTDRDQAQVNAIRDTYPTSRVFYCWWHVLRAIRTHFVVTEFKELWDLIQKWVRTPDKYQFESMWEDIQSDESVPKSVTQYLAREWVSVKEMWSAVYRQDRTIFEEGDTNMLLEAYHHVLKSKWLDGKRNRRIDHLIHLLVNEVMPDAEDRIKRQLVIDRKGDLAQRRRREILTRAPEILQDHITQVEDMRFQVRSSNQEKIYEVDLLKTKCTCQDFPRIEFCKHIASAQHYFGKAEPPAPINSNSQPNQPNPISPVSCTTEGGNVACDQNAASSSLISVTNEIIVLSQNLRMQTPNPEAVSNTVKSLRSIRSHLAAVIVSASTTGDNPQLPEKEQIAPNQHSWTETAERMGVRRGNKSRGKVDSARTAELIGEINRKRNREDEDPYGAGELSGKRARPDARSATANARARATAKPATPLDPPTSLPPRLSPRAPELGPPLLPLSQPAPRSARPHPPPMSLPSHLPFPRAPGPLPPLPPPPPYYSSPFLSQPFPYPGFNTPYYPLYYPSQ